MVHLWVSIIHVTCNRNFAAISCVEVGCWSLTNRNGWRHHRPEVVLQPHPLRFDQLRKQNTIPSWVNTRNGSCANEVISIQKQCPQKNVATCCNSQRFGAHTHLCGFLPLIKHTADQQTLPATSCSTEHFLAHFAPLFRSGFRLFQSPTLVLQARYFHQERPGVKGQQKERERQEEEEDVRTTGLWKREAALI